MFICQGNLGYDAKERLMKLSDDEYARLRARLPPERIPVREEVSSIDTWSYSHNVVMDSDEVQAWSDFGFTVSMSKVKGVHYSGALPHGANVPNGIAGTTIINVSVPNVGLFDVRRVEWLEDCCTQELQRHLDDGWRLLAVCPPNDSRRPTYILGKIGVA